MKKTGKLVANVIIILCLLEIIARATYYYKPIGHQHFAIHGFIARRIHYALNMLAGKDPKSRSPEELKDEPNPFTTFEGKRKFKMHPFINFSGAQTVYGGKFREDYFGFRNKEDLYFNEDRDYVLIILSGGSESLGSKHETTINENLTKILNERTNRKFKSINLSMGAYSIAEELNAYVNLVYHLKPEIVITHSGWNDLQAVEIPNNFKQLGLHYFPQMEWWLARLYRLQEFYPKKGEPIKEQWDLVGHGYFKTLEKYKKIVETNAGLFIVGLQGYNTTLVPAEKYPLKVKTINDIIDKGEAAGYINFMKVDNITYHDSIHTDDPSSKRIAEVYADIIIKKLKLRTN